MESAVASDSLTALEPFMEGKAGQVYYSHAIVAWVLSEDTWMLRQ